MANNTEDIEWVKPLESIVNNLVSNDDYQVKSLLDDLRKLNKLIQQEATRQKAELLDRLRDSLKSRYGYRDDIDNQYDEGLLAGIDDGKEQATKLIEAERRKLEEGK